MIDQLSGVRPWVRPSVDNYMNISETGQQISMKLHKNDPWMMHFQNTSKILISLRTGCHGNRKKKTLKIFLSQIVRVRVFIFDM